LAFDDALNFIKGSVLGHTSKTTYLHGSFGRGTSHFMAILHLILKCHTPAARQELNAAFEQTAKIHESVMTTLLTGASVGVGVIIGPDLVIRDGKWQAVPEARSRNDSSIKGYKKLQKSEPLEAARRAREIIKNTYRTLMTRGQKGCFVWSADLETNLWLKQQVPTEHRLLAAAEESAEYRVDGE